jgi:FkbM family methyltransferase
MYVPADRAWAFKRGAYYEANVSYWLERMTRQTPNAVIYDIGANYGYYTLLLTHLADHVYAFEPVSKTFDVLSRNIKLNDLSNVTAYRLGLSDHTGAAVMHLYSSSGNDSLVVRLPNDHPAKPIGYEEIELSTLDALSKTDGLRPPDVLKLDVEGSELAILRGARETIRRHAPVLLVEYHTEEWFASVSSEKVIAELRSQGYEILGLSDDGQDLKLYPFDLGSVKFANLLALPPGRASFDTNAITTGNYNSTVI